MTLVFAVGSTRLLNILPLKSFFSVVVEIFFAGLLMYEIFDHAGFMTVYNDQSINPFFKVNQINARAVIGQTAMVYCAGKLMEKSCVF